MATFRYIGTETKANGKVDVRCRNSAGETLQWLDVTPNSTVIDVGSDAKCLKDFEYAVNASGAFTYQRVS